MRVALMSTETLWTISGVDLADVEKFIAVSTCEDDFRLISLCFQVWQRSRLLPLVWRNECRRFSQPHQAQGGS